MSLRVIILTFSSRSCCLNSSSSSESQSGNWYTLIPNFSISSLTLNRRMKNIGYVRSPDTWSEDAACVNVNRVCACINRLIHFTLSFIFLISAGVRQSALEMRGTTFTLSCSAFINSTSTGRSLRGRGASEWHTLFTLLSKKETYFHKRGHVMDNKIFQVWCTYKIHITIQMLGSVRFF